MATLRPIVLYGTTPSTIAAGQNAALSDELAIQNWTPYLMRIREVRFDFQTSTPNERWVPTAEVEMRVGNEPCSNGYVPLGAISWPLDANPALRASDRSKPSHTSFASPVYLAPGERLYVKVRAPATFGGSATAFRPHVFAVGHLVEGENPRSGFLPWFAGYTAVSRAAAGVFSEQSDPSVFQNSFKTSPLVVDRFIGNWTLDPLRALPAGATLDDYAYGAKLIRVRCEDHLGNQLVRDATPFGVVFDQTRRYWRVKTELAPKGFFKFTLESDLRGLSPTFPQAIIGMLGFRPSLGR